MLLLNTMAGRRDDGFERLSRIARQLLKAPMAMISLFDGQTHHLANNLEEFKSEDGRRSFIQSICEAVVAQDAAVAICNLQTSALASNIPAIADLRLGAFLGLPLLASGGEVLGVLGVMDHGTREWSKDEVAALSDVGHAAIAEIEGRFHRHHWELSERELRERDETLTLAELSAGIGVWDVDLATGQVHGTPQFFRIMGLEPSVLPVSIELLRSLRHPEDRDRVVRGFREAVESGQDSYEMEYRIVRPDGETRWIFGRGRVIRDAASMPLRYSGVDIDITERKQAEEHRLLLVNELNHRVKNILATVQAIASQTFRGSSVEKRLRGAFEGRIFALSKAHDLLTSENWRGAELSDLVTETLAPFGINDRESGRISVEGGAITLPSRKAMAISMALHELATNAAKYGALSNSMGRVAIAWRIEAEAQVKRLRLLWREIDGPPVRKPKSRGFGSHLIERLPRELQGEVSLDYRPEGLLCEIMLPVTGD